MSPARRVAVVLAGLWGGVLVCIALIAAPAAFAALAPADAGRVVARIFRHEAFASLALAVVLFLFARRSARAAATSGHGSVLSAEILLVLGTLFCTVAGYFAVQPMMEAARAGQGPYSFAVLHGVSLGFYGLKTLLVLVLAWRLSAARSAP